jgi:predicted nucleic acid-binding protein
MYLLDTNVVSEIRKASAGRADPNVVRWAGTVPALRLFISVITLMELESGVLLMERRDGPQGARLRAWLTERVLPSFAGRVLGIDEAVARRAAGLHIPDPRPMADSLIAATALVHDMTVVTRNRIDFESTGVSLLDPWQDR